MLPVNVRNTEREASGLVRSAIFLCCLFELVRLRQYASMRPGAAAHLPGGAANNHTHRRIILRPAGHCINSMSVMDARTDQQIGLLPLCQTGV